MRSRMAVREVAKVLAIPLKVVDSMVKFMGREGLIRLEESPEKATEWQINPKTFQLLTHLARAMKGFHRALRSRLRQTLLVQGEAPKHLLLLCRWHPCRRRFSMQKQSLSRMPAPTAGFFRIRSAATQTAPTTNFMPAFRVGGDISLLRIHRKPTLCLSCI